MKNLLISCAAVAFAAIASADTLNINSPLNDGNTITAQITDVSLGVNVDAYVGSLNGSLTDGPDTTPLPYFDCVDIVDDISIPTSYDVTPSLVFNATAWLIDYAYSPTMSDSQDAGLQLAIWSVTFPGVTFSNDSDPASLVYMAADLAADGNGTKKAEGVLLSRDGGYGQSMEYASADAPRHPMGNLPSLPGPLAMLPFAIGILARRRRNA
jgi:hypothetical protein